MSNALPSLKSAPARDGGAPQRPRPTPVLGPRRAAPRPDATVTLDPRLQFGAEPLRGHLAAQMIDAVREAHPRFHVDSVGAYFAERIGTAPLSSSVELRVGGASTLHYSVRLLQDGDCVASASIVLQRSSLTQRSSERIPIDLKTPAHVRPVEPASDHRYAHAFCIRKVDGEHAPRGYIRPLEPTAIDAGMLATAIDAFLASTGTDSPGARELHLRLRAMLPEAAADPRHFLAVVSDAGRGAVIGTQTGHVISGNGRLLARFERRA